MRLHTCKGEAQEPRKDHNIARLSKKTWFREREWARDRQSYSGGPREATVRKETVSSFKWHNQELERKEVVDLQWLQRKEAPDPSTRQLAVGILQLFRPLARHFHAVCQENGRSEAQSKGILPTCMTDHTKYFQRGSCNRKQDNQYQHSRFISTSWGTGSETAQTWGRPGQNSRICNKGSLRRFWISTDECGKLVNWPTQP